MQISIDIRGYDSTTPYGKCVIEAVLQLTETYSEAEYLIYTHQIPSTSLGKNTTVKIAQHKKQSFLDQHHFKKILQKDSSSLYLFFDEFVPVGLKKEYMVIIPSLREVFFPQLSFVKKYIYQRTLSLTLKHATTVLCFENSTEKELNERLNVKEEKISVIYPFFSTPERIYDISDIKLDIKAKHNLSSDYILYDAGNDNNSNFERILKIFQKLIQHSIPISLLIICEDVTRDIELRQKAIDFRIEKSVLFIGGVEKKEEVFYYTQSRGVIFPSIYSSFPFYFSKAISYNCPILASDLKSTREIMGDSITYFNARSTGESSSQIQKFLGKNTKTISYDRLGARINIQNTVKQLKENIVTWVELPGK